MSIKSSIGWCDITLNPIKGLCQGGCWYCYYSGKRGFARRFKQDPELRLDLSVFDRLPKASKKVFLCSTNDYWGGWVSDEWRKAIRQKTQEYPQHTFQLLTKQYQNLVLLERYPDNWWVGVTATNNDRAYEASFYLSKIKATIRFISFEPLLGEVYCGDWQTEGWWLLKDVDWVIIGRLTGFGHKYDPKVEWIDKIVNACVKHSVPVFLKDNLARLLGKPDNRELRQEMPK